MQELPAGARIEPARCVLIRHAASLRARVGPARRVLPGAELPEADAAAYPGDGTEAHMTRNGSRRRELPGERASYRMGAVVNVVLLAGLTVALLVVGLTIEPFTLLAVPIALLLLLHFIRVATAAWRADPVPRVRDDALVVGLRQLVATEALDGPVSSNRMAERLLPFVDDERERREVVLHAVAALLRSRLALAGRIARTGERTALSAEAALEHIREALADDPDPVWIALTDRGRAQALAWRDERAGDADPR